jgi:ELWxxDGT repeat protein
VCGDFRVVSGVLYLAGDDGVHGCELWKVDPTTGAQMVKNVRLTTRRSIRRPASSSRMASSSSSWTTACMDSSRGRVTEPRGHLPREGRYPGPDWSIMSDGLVPSGGKIYFPGNDG